MKSLQYIYRWFMWNILSRIFVVLVLRRNYRFFTVKGSDPFPRPPFILIANHGTFFDPWIACYGSRWPIALMCNDDAFRGSPITRWYLRSIGAFPKKKGAADFKAMKTTMALLKAGYPVCIFPEGQTTWDGETQLIYRGVERILKKTGCPLVAVHLQGNFLTKPWWAETVRKGKIVVTTRVLKADEISRMSPDELFLRMKELIRHNDIRDPANASVPFRGKELAAGLERFVWICMQCEAEDRLVTRGDRITCDACGAQWRIDGHCRLSPSQPDVRCLPDLKAWADRHREKVLARIDTVQPGTPVTAAVSAVLEMEKSGTFLPQAGGMLHLTREALTFSPDISSEPSLSIPIERIDNYVIQQKDVFECTFEGVDYRFRFSGHSPMKWIYYIRYLKGYRECEMRGYLD